MIRVSLIVDPTMMINQDDKDIIDLFMNTNPQVDWTVITEHDNYCKSNEVGCEDGKVIQL